MAFEASETFKARHVGCSMVSGLLNTLARADRDRVIQSVLLIFVAGLLVVAVVLPLAHVVLKSLSGPGGEWAGLSNFKNYFNTPNLWNSVKNSMTVSLVTTFLVVPAAFLFAYGLTRTTIGGKGILFGMAMVPLLAPTLLNGLVLVYLFGRQGLVTKGLFGLFPGFDIGLYGPVGVVLAEIVYTFPQAVLILATALRLSDGQIADAARSMGVSPARFFWNVTLPSVKYALASSCMLCFILALTDFGAPKIVGANYSLLATDIYKQVIGQQNFAMGSVVSVVLLLPVIVAFAVDFAVRRGQGSQLGGRSKPYSPRPHKIRDSFFSFYCWGGGLLMVLFFSVAALASLVKVWPYDLTPGFEHYSFFGVGGGGYGALWGSLKMAFLSAVAGTFFCFASAYLVEKSRGLGVLRRIVAMLGIIPLALPGMVLGLSYIFFFNTPSWEIGRFTFPNPFNGLYGTMAILVLCNSIHFFTVGFFTATSALKQLDCEFETVSYAMGVPFWEVLRKVTVVVCSPAILEIFFFFFVNCMTTVSAVIFLYNADLPLASVAIANMDDAGDLAPACAMGVLIMLVNVGMRLLKSGIGHWLHMKNGRWLAVMK